MCKYILSALVLILLSNQVYAANTCGYSKPQGRGESASARCDSCRTLQEFALYGAGALHGRFDDRIEVHGSQGSIVSVETEVPIVTYSFTLFGFSQSVSYPDFSRRLVNAVDVTGIVPGREDGSVITTHATSLKCKQNELEEKRRAQQEANTRDAGVGASGRATNFVTNGLSGLHNFRGYFGRLREPIINTYSEGRSSRGRKSTTRSLHPVNYD